MIKLPYLALCLLFAGLGQLTAADEANLGIDKEHSRLEIDVNSTAASFVAKLESFDATFSVDLATARIVYAQLRFRFADLKTADSERDHRMRDWQSTEQFPEVVYWMTSLESTPEGKYIAHGKLLFHGQTHDLTFPLSIKSPDKKAYTLEGETELDTREWGLPIFRRYGLFKVEPIVKIRFHLQGTVARNAATTP